MRLSQKLIRGRFHLEVTLFNHSHCVAGELRYGERRFAVFKRKRKFSVFGLEDNPADRIGGLHRNFYVVQRHKILDDLCRVQLALIAAKLQFAAAQNRRRIENMADCAVLGILAHQSDASGRRQIFRLHLAILAEEGAERIHKELFVHHCARCTVKRENRMRKAENSGVKHNRIKSGGFRLVRRVLVGTEMLNRTVEVRIVNLCS